MKNIALATVIMFTIVACDNGHEQSAGVESAPVMEKEDTANRPLSDLELKLISFYNSAFLNIKDSLDYAKQYGFLKGGVACRTGSPEWRPLEGFNMQKGDLVHSMHFFTVKGQNGDDELVLFVSEEDGQSCCETRTTYLMHGEHINLVKGTFSDVMRSNIKARDEAFTRTINKGEDRGLGFSTKITVKGHEAEGAFLIGADDPRPYSPLPALRNVFILDIKKNSVTFLWEDDIADENAGGRLTVYVHDASQVKMNNDTTPIVTQDLGVRNWGCYP